MTEIDLSPAVARAALHGLVSASDLDSPDIVHRYARSLWSALAEPGDGVAADVILEQGPVEGIRMLERWMAGHPVTIAGVGQEDLMRACKRWAPRLAEASATLMTRAARHASVRLIVPGDAHWPTALDDLGRHAPLCLWVRGDPAQLVRPMPSVALVGARAATSYGEHVAVELSAELAGGGISIVSGAAYGIDGAAHRAALAAGGTTIALLAGGVERPYPAGHSKMLARIASTGAVVSEVPCGSVPTKWRFLQRNRLIAALSDATVVVEAGWRSGSLNTAAHAAALARPLGAIPGPITSAASAGCHRLLREFDARCITTAADVRELMGLGEESEGPGSRWSADTGSAQAPTDERTRVRDALSTRAWRDTADIARRSGMSAEDVEMILGFLHLDGEAHSGPDGWRRIIPSAHRG